MAKKVVDVASGEVDFDDRRFDSFLLGFRGVLDCFDDDVGIDEMNHSVIGGQFPGSGRVVALVQVRLEPFHKCVFAGVCFAVRHRVFSYSGEGFRLQEKRQSFSSFVKSE